MAEEARVSARNVRREEIDKFKKMQKGKDITEDDLRDAEKEVQAITDAITDKINSLLKDKEEEIFTV